MSEQTDRDEGDVPSGEDWVREMEAAVRSYDRRWRLFLTSGDIQGIARTCVAVEGQHTAALRAEVERLRRLLGKLACDCDDYGDWHMTHRLYEWKRRAEKAEATTARVEALAADWPCSDEWCDGDCTGCAYANDLRAALRGPEPTEDGQ